MANKENQNKIHRLNIYLTWQDKKILNEIRDKYHISYSAIAKVIVFNLMTNSKGIWLDHYYHEDTNSTKTSIKPRCMNDEMKQYLQELKRGGTSMLFTNCIKAFTRKEIGKLTGWPEKEVQRRTSQIYNQFQQEYDPNWNGNAFAHQIAKFIKNNPGYTKKLLGQEDI